MYAIFQKDFIEFIFFSSKLRILDTKEVQSLIAKSGLILNELPCHKFSFPYMTNNFRFLKVHFFLNIFDLIFLYFLPPGY